jgi:hypothetical protein
VYYAFERFSHVARRSSIPTCRCFGAWTLMST